MTSRVATRPGRTQGRGSREPERAGISRLAAILTARTDAGPASGFLGDIQILGDVDDTTGAITPPRFRKRAMNPDPDDMKISGMARRITSPTHRAPRVAPAGVEPAGVAPAGVAPAGVARSRPPPRPGLAGGDQGGCGESAAGIAASPRPAPRRADRARPAPSRRPGPPPAPPPGPNRSRRRRSGVRPHLRPQPRWRPDRSACRPAPGCRAAPARPRRRARAARLRPDPGELAGGAAAGPRRNPVRSGPGSATRRPRLRPR